MTYLVVVAHILTHDCFDVVGFCVHWLLGYGLIGEAWSVWVFNYAFGNVSIKSKCLYSRSSLIRTPVATGLVNLFR